MPSDFHGGRRTPRQRTLADLLRELQPSPATARPAHTTSPISGPGRIRNQNNAARNRETELDRRKRLAEETLRRLKG